MLELGSNTCLKKAAVSRAGHVNGSVHALIAKIRFELQADQTSLIGSAVARINGHRNDSRIEVPYRSVSHGSATAISAGRGPGQPYDRGGSGFPRRGNEVCLGNVEGKNLGRARKLLGWRQHTKRCVRPKQGHNSAKW